MKQRIVVVVRNANQHDFLYKRGEAPKNNGIYKYPMFAYPDQATWNGYDKDRYKNDNSVKVMEFEEYVGMDNLQPGNIIEMKDMKGVKCKVFAVMGELVALSEDNDYEEFDNWFVLETIKKEWQLETPTEITTMTLDEVAAMKGIPVEQLRIKD